MCILKLCSLEFLPKCVSEIIICVWEQKMFVTLSRIFIIQMCLHDVDHVYVCV